jgi:hypothetical protein
MAVRYEEKLITLKFEPGIQRDGTELSSKKWSQGLWARFYRGRPQKMEGYRQLIDNATNIPRGTIIVPTSPNFNVYIADQSTLKYFTIDQFGNLIGGFVNRTPVGFNANINNDWSFDTSYSTVNNSGILLAYAGQHLSSIENTFETPIYYGDINQTTPLISTGISCSGGMVSLHPFMFFFGNNGEIGWTAANDPTTIVNTARVAGSKIVAGMPTRAGNSGPGGLFWSLDSVIRATNSGPSIADYNFDIVENECSILSNKSIVKHNSNYYWVGIDSFLFYNGAVLELPNNTNLNFFFNNLNYAQRQKVWGTKVAEWGEIWWFFPFGDSVECNHAVVYNYRENTWYDTEIARSCGDFDQTFNYPIWCDNAINGGGNYSVWQHEYGLDQNVNSTLTAIHSYIQSGTLSLCQQGVDKQIILDRVEPDFNLSGNMNLAILSRSYAQAEQVSSNLFTFGPDTNFINPRGPNVMGRQMMLLFDSFEVGGYFQMGDVLLNIKVGDSRQGRASH